MPAVIVFEVTAVGAQFHFCFSECMRRNSCRCSPVVKYHVAVVLLGILLNGACVILRKNVGFTSFFLGTVTLNGYSVLID